MNRNICINDPQGEVRAATNLIQPTKNVFSATDKAETRLRSARPNRKITMVSILSKQGQLSQSIHPKPHICSFASKKKTLKSRVGQATA